MENSGLGEVLPDHGLGLGARHQAADPTCSRLSISSARVSAADDEGDQRSGRSGTGIDDEAVAEGLLGGNLDWRHWHRLAGQADTHDSTDDGHAH